MSKYSSFGTLLQIGDGGSPENFTTVAGVMDVDGPGLSSDNEDATTHESPGGYEEIIPTLKRTGDVTFDIVWDPSDPTHDGTTGLLAEWKNQSKTNYQLVFPDTGNETFGFAAYILEVGPSAPVSGLLKASVRMKVTGQPTLP